VQKIGMVLKLKNLKLKNLKLKKWLGMPRLPDARQQPLWELTQLTFFVLPFSPFGGGMGLIVLLFAGWQQRWRSIVRQPFAWAWLGLCVWMLICTGLALQPGDALLGLFNFLPFILLFLVLCDLIQTPAQLRRLAWILVVPAVPVVAIGLAQQFWHWGGQVQILQFVINWNIDPNGTPPGRMSSIFFYANVLASYLLIPLILGLGLWIDEIRATQKSRKSQRRFGWLRQGVLSVAVLGSAIALIFTNSRNGWAIAAIAGLAFGCYLGWRWLFVGVGTVASLILGAAFAPLPLRDGLRQIVPAFFWARLTDELYPDRPTNQLRSTQWNFAWLLAQQRPWTGWGFRSFGPLYEAHSQLYLGHPHNLFIMLMAETGIPAALLLFGLVGWLVMRSSLRLAEVADSDRLICFSFLMAFLGCTLFSLLDVTLFDVRLNAIGWLLLAALWGGCRQQLPSHSLNPEST
jgi:O-antigen ligase